MMFRYFGLIWDPSNPTDTVHAQRSADRLSRQGAWETVLHSRGLQVLCRGHSSALTAHRLANGLGVVLGTLFPRISGACNRVLQPHESFTDPETHRILATSAKALLTDYWGRYVALITDPISGVLRLIKEPTGRLPCFIHRDSNLVTVFSYLPDWLAACSAPAHPVQLNTQFLAARIALGAARADDTGIEGVSELCGGECVEFRLGLQTRQLYWNPAKLSQAPLEEPVHATQLLRDTTQHCVDHWATRYPSILHRLSGGLDSSIVLACLARAPSAPRVACLTYFRPGGVSDERPWARQAAQDQCWTHVEHGRDAYIDLSVLSRMNPAASPPMTTGFLEADELERSLVERFQAHAVCSGDGGDSLFGASAARFSVLTFLKRCGPKPALLRIASDLALLHDQTVWEVLYLSLRRLFRPPDTLEALHLRRARALVSADVREPMLVKRESFAHPWFRSGSVHPAVRDLLSFLTLPDQFYSPVGDADEDRAETLYPLLSQPLVELCARIPADIHFHGGIDRSLARSAFAYALPAPILGRCWKDRVQGFPEEILERNRAAIREWLLDGILIRDGYLNRAMTEAALSRDIAAPSASAGEILDHAIVEGWIQSIRRAKRTDSP